MRALLSQNINAVNNARYILHMGLPCFIFMADHIEPWSKTPKAQKSFNKDST